MRSPRFGLQLPKPASTSDEAEEGAASSLGGKKITKLPRGAAVDLSVVQKAAAHVEDGLEGRDAHGKAFSLKQPQFTQWAFVVQTSPAFLQIVIVCMLLIMGLSFFHEESSVSSLLMLAALCVVTIDVGLKVCDPCVVVPTKSCN